MSSGSFWLVIALAGSGTLAMRLVPFLAHGRVALPSRVQRLLGTVPAAAVAALAVPGSVIVGAGEGYVVEPERVVAAAVALLVAIRTKNFLVTLAVGMTVLWVLRAVS